MHTVRVNQKIFLARAVLETGQVDRLHAVGGSGGGRAVAAVQDNQVTAVQELDEITGAGAALNASTILNLP
jgi:hypothetical protein